MSFPVVGTDRGWFDLRPLTADIDGPFFERVRPEVVLQAVDQGRLPLVGDTDALRVGAPIAHPGKVVCIGLNYRDHAEETVASTARRAGGVHEGPGQPSSGRTTTCSSRAARRRPTGRSSSAS